jgi:AGZA family xanthine/uracil permease-like MFS transporter
MPVQYITVGAIVLAFVLAAFAVRFAHGAVQRALDRTEGNSAENRAALHQRAKKLIRTVMLLAFGVAALASISLVLSWLGVISVMVSLVPVVAISPILLYIGMLIGAQAFQETPKSHAPAIILALTPHLAAWGKLQIDNALGAAGTNAAAVGLDKLGANGILYEGLAILGGGAILGGLVLAAIAVFVIERQMLKAAAFAFAGAVLTFFGFMHGEQIGFAESPQVAVAYVGVAVVLGLCAKTAVTVPASAPVVTNTAPIPVET